MPETVNNPLDEYGEQSLLYIKPHATWMGVENEIRMILERNRFWMLKTERLLLREEGARQFLLEIFGVADEAEVKSFTGSGVMFVVAKKDAVAELRKLCGDDDPESARIGTLHKMYGYDRHDNGVWAPTNHKQFASAFGLLRTWNELYMAALKGGGEKGFDEAERYMKMITGQSESGEDEAAGDEKTAPDDTKEATVEKVAGSYGDPVAPAGS